MASGNYEKLFSVYEDNDEKSGKTALNERIDYSVSGNGIVVVASGNFTNVNTYGGFTTRIYHNNTLVMLAGTRTNQSSAVWMGSFCAVPIEVTDGDQIGIFNFNNKTSSSTTNTVQVHRRIMCIGDCSVQRITT